MAALDRYILRFKGLSVGTHHFEYTVDDDFFSAFEESEVRQGDIQVAVEVKKQASLLTLDFVMDGGVDVPCDRCVEQFRIPVHYQGTLLVKFTDEPPESDGDIMWLHPVESEIDLAQYIYESILLSLPYQRIHPLDEQGNSTCDPEMLKRFRIVSSDEFDVMFPQEEVDADSKSESQAAWENQLAALRERMENEEQEP
ncbi:MAG: YceD family protein [Rikenellaceae bacterium]|nr:YceD family protein [Rikenellaceae bacterium]